MMVLHSKRALFTSCLLMVGAAFLSLPACGGGGGGGSTGRGLVLSSFLEDGLDNLPINRILTWRFSEPVDPATITTGTLETVDGSSVLNPLYGPGTGSIQIRQGPQFGLTAEGTFFVDGSVVTFQPKLPSRCDLADAGLTAGTQYRVQLMGDPEEFPIRNVAGQPLQATVTLQFATLPDSDPAHLEDQVPATAPSVQRIYTAGEGYDLTTPITGGVKSASVPAVDVHAGNALVVVLSENIDPCSVNSKTVILSMTERGQPDVNDVVTSGPTAGNTTGFDSITDLAPSDERSWGASNSISISPAQRVPVKLVLEQSFSLTTLRVAPLSGAFPENALLVLDLSRDILDFGGQSLTPATIGFTTENLPMQTGQVTIEFDATTPIDDPATSADVNTARSPGRAQGWMIFAGDGDNGPDMTYPSFPASPTNCTFRPNDMQRDDFDPTGNVTLDTGSTRNTCVNSVDGSYASVWEFASLTIRSGVTVKVVGVNPAIILVDGDVSIQSGGTLLLRGGNGNRASTQNNYYYYKGGTGGKGVAGGGDGGAGGDGYYQGSTNWAENWGDDGGTGYGSPSYPQGTGQQTGAVGPGEGGTKAVKPYYPYYATNTNGQGGGGGGHGTAGTDGQAVFLPNPVNYDVKPAGAIRGAGGGTYPTGPNAVRMLTPSAGSGGGGAGGFMQKYSSGYYYYDAGGGGGGAGGGFVDITAAGNIRVEGTIDARGGNGGAGVTYAYGASVGGGGGSGGGVRLLTPNEIDLTNGTIDTSGGVGGQGATPSYTGYWQGPAGVGGSGGLGRIALEDGDSVIGGLKDGSATLYPGEGQDANFWRGVFDATRFSSSSVPSIATTLPILLGPLAPTTLLDPAQADFLAGVPVTGARGAGKVAAVIEIRGYGITTDGSVDLSSATPWYTVGCLVDSGNPVAPDWKPGKNPSDLGELPALDPSNAGIGIQNVDGSAYVAIRITFVLPDGIGALDPGPYIDRMTIHFTYDE